MILVYLFTYGNQNVCRFEVRVFVKPSILPSDIQSAMATLSEECITMHHVIHTSSFGNHILELSWFGFLCLLNILAYWISYVEEWNLDLGLLALARVDHQTLRSESFVDAGPTGYDGDSGHLTHAHKSTSPSHITACSQVNTLKAPEVRFVTDSYHSF